MSEREQRMAEFTETERRIADGLRDLRNVMVAVVEGVIPPDVLGSTHEFIPAVHDFYSDILARADSLESFAKSTADKTVLAEARNIKRLARKILKALDRVQRQTDAIEDAHFSGLLPGPETA